MAIILQAIMASMCTPPWTLITPSVATATTALIVIVAGSKSDECENEHVLFGLDLICANLLFPAPSSNLQCETARVLSDSRAESSHERAHMRVPQ